MVGCRRSLWLCRIEPGLAVPKLRFNWVAVEDSWEEVAREVQWLSAVKRTGVLTFLLFDWENV